MYLLQKYWQREKNRVWLFFIFLNFDCMFFYAVS